MRPRGPRPQRRQAVLAAVRLPCADSRQNAVQGFASAEGGGAELVTVQGQVRPCA